MVRRNRLRNGRHQAQFGADGAIMAAATLAAAGINAASTAAASKQQAKAVEESAKLQADSLVKQNENANRLQEKNIEFTKEQNEINRDLQKNIQMNLQLLTGQQNTNEMKEAAKIQVKHGGSMRKRLKNMSANTSNTFLRGRNGNLPFVVTDGGGVIPIATTPEGYDLYEIIGNDHEHYHKAQGGKNKTGVGIKFAKNETIEGEGNQNGNQGELMLVTPTDAKFISKHSLKGYNPAKAVLAGVHPMQAFAIQEAIKDANGISDDGKSGKRTPVRSMRPYGGISTLELTPDLSLDFLAPVATGVVAGTRKDLQARNGRCLRKCGGRRKAEGGLGWYAGASGVGFLANAASNIWGANVLGNAYGNAYNKMRDAYGRMHGIDENLVDYKDFAPAHQMAALQAPISTDSAARATAERSMQRRLKDINRNTLSSAAAQNRRARVESDYIDTISNISANETRNRQNIIQGNMQRLTDVSGRNAELDTQARQNFMASRLDLLKYNNDIANEKIEGEAQAYVDSVMGRANAKSTAISNIGQSASNTVMGIGSAIANYKQNQAKMAHEENMTYMGMDSSSKYDALMSGAITDNPAGKAKVLYDMYIAEGDEVKANALLRTYGKKRNGEYTWD